MISVIEKSCVSTKGFCIRNRISSKSNDVIKVWMLGNEVTYSHTPLTEWDEPTRTGKKVIVYANIITTPMQLHRTLEPFFRIRTRQKHNPIKKTYLQPISLLTKQTMETAARVNDYCSVATEPFHPNVRLVIIRISELRKS